MNVAASKRVEIFDSWFMRVLFVSENFVTFFTCQKQEKDGDQSLALQEKEGRNKLASMAFKKLFPNLPANVQEEWLTVKSEGRAKATDWLNKRMTKNRDGKWVFSMEDASRIAQQNTSFQQEGKSQALKKAVPRFRAIAKAGGEMAFKQALADGEIIEIRGQDNKPMFMWKEEMLQVGSTYSTGTQFSQSESVGDFADFSSMVDMLDFQGEHMASQWQQFLPQQRQQQLALPSSGFNMTMGNPNPLGNLGNQMANPLGNQMANPLALGNVASSSNAGSEPVTDALWGKLDEVRKRTFVNSQQYQVPVVRLSFESYESLRVMRVLVVLL